MLVLTSITAAGIVGLLVLASAAMFFEMSASAAIVWNETCLANTAVPVTLKPYWKARLLRSNMELFELTIDGIAHMDIWCS